MKPGVETSAAGRSGATAFDIFAELRDAKPSKIREGLYLGGIGSLGSVDELEISHVLSITEMTSAWSSRNLGSEVNVKASNHKVISVPDLPTTDLLRHLPDAVAFIDNGVSTGGSVLVHCMAGVSRSTTAVAAYLMKTEHLTQDEALDSIRKSRGIISPNLGFLQQLQEWHANGCQGVSLSSLNRTNSQPSLIRPRISAGSSGMRSITDQLRTDSDPSLIREGLYLGSLRSLGDAEALQITHVLSAVNMAGGWAASQLAKADSHVPQQNRLQISLEDVSQADILQHFPAACSFIAGARAACGKVLVHCLAGVSRSTTIVVAYLMRSENLSRDDALLSVQQRRGCACPNAGFMDQLQQWQDMGCQLKADSAVMQRRALDDLTDRAMADANGHPSLDSQDLMPSPSDSPEAAEELLYRCRTCRRLLATSSCIMPLNDAGASGNDDASLFVNPMKYMETSILGVMQGKLYCPKCKARLGSFNWAGMKNNKGVLVVPAFQLHLSRMDRMPPPLAAGPISLTAPASSMRLRL